MKNLILKHLLIESNINNNFWKWFGNSVTLEKTGEPMIFYHGTPNGQFTVFDVKPGKTKKTNQQADFGSHFIQDKEFAEEYTQKKKTKTPKLYEVYLKIENPLYTNEMIWKEDSPQKFEIYLNFAKKVFGRQFKQIYGGDYYYNKNGEKQDTYQSIMIGNFHVDRINPNKMYNALLEFNFDGMTHVSYQRSGMRHVKFNMPSYIVLKPNQIKAIDNDGTWDINDDNIYS